MICKYTMPFLEYQKLIIHLRIIKERQARRKSEVEKSFVKIDGFPYPATKACNSCVSMSLLRNCVSMSLLCLYCLTVSQ